MPYLAAIKTACLTGAVFVMGRGTNRSEVLFEVVVGHRSIRKERIANALNTIK